MKKQNPFAREIGAALLGWRELRGLRQDDVAAAARRAGLPWTRSMVLSIEAGRRDVTVDEFVRIPLLLECLGVTTTPVDVVLTSKGTTAQMHIWGRDTPPVDLTAPWLGQADTERVERAYRAVDWFTRVHGPGGEIRMQRREAAVRQAYEAAGGELEQKIGRKWKLDPLIVALVGITLWGHSPTIERDRRVADEQSTDSVSRRTLQASRGHATRALLKELAPELLKAAARLRPRRRLPS